ncbi:hypothetical protein D3C72_1646970 [compost metagenome]
MVVDQVGADDRRRCVVAQHFVVVEVALPALALVKADLAHQRNADAHDGRAFHLRADAFGVDLGAAVERHVHGQHPDLAFVIHLDLNHGGRIGHKAVGKRQPQAAPLGQLAAPARAACGSLNHIAQAPGVVGVAFRVFAVVPGVGQGLLWIELSGWADQVQRVLLVVLARMVSQLGNEALGGERMRNVVDRSEPADA